MKLVWCAVVLNFRNGQVRHGLIEQLVDHLAEGGWACDIVVGALALQV